MFFLFLSEAFPGSISVFQSVNPISDFIQLVVEPTHLKNMSQIGSFPQIGVKIKIHETTCAMLNTSTSSQRRLSPTAVSRTGKSPQVVEDRHMLATPGDTPGKINGWFTEKSPEIEQQNHLNQTFIIWDMKPKNHPN